MMLKRIGTLVILLILTLTAVCSAYSSGITERKQATEESYTHDYSTSMSCDAMHTPSNIGCEIHKEYTIHKDASTHKWRESVLKYLRIKSHKTEMKKIVYLPKNVEFITYDDNDKIVSKVIIQNTLKYIPASKEELLKQAKYPTTFYISNTEFEQLQEMFHSNNFAKLVLHVYDTESNTYEYPLSWEQMQDIRVVLMS